MGIVYAHRCYPIVGDDGTVLGSCRGGELSEGGRTALAALVTAAVRADMARDTPERRERRRIGALRMRSVIERVRRRQARMSRMRAAYRRRRR